MSRFFTIEEIVTKDYSWFKQNLPWVCLENAGEIDPFLEQYYSEFGPSMMLTPNQIPSYCETSAPNSRYKNRYMVLDVSDIKVLVFMRIMDSIGMRRYGHDAYFQMCWPISETGNFDVEEMVFAEISQIECVKTFSCPFLTSDIPPANYNFYGTIEDLEHMRSAKFRKKHHFRKIEPMLSTDTYTLSSIPETVVEGIHNLCKSWNMVRTGSPRNWFEEDRILSTKDDRIRLIVFSIKGTVVAYSFIVMYRFFSISIVSKTVAVLGKERISEYVGKEYADILYHSLGIYVSFYRLYYTISECGSKAMYVLGIAIQNTKLRRHQQERIVATKSETFSGCIQYSNADLEVFREIISERFRSYCNRFEMRRQHSCVSDL